MIKLIAIAMIMTLGVTLALAASRDITSVEAKNLLVTNKNTFVLDVRTPQEFGQARLAGAVLIPVDELERRIDEVPRNKKILVYCAVGSRSKTAVNYLLRQGYKEVYHMSDGIIGWYRNGFQIQR